jgi:hypothetical protein
MSKGPWKKPICRCGKRTCKPCRDRQRSQDWRDKRRDAEAAEDYRKIDSAIAAEQQQCG